MSPLPEWMGKYEAERAGIIQDDRYDEPRHDREDRMDARRHGE